MLTAYAKDLYTSMIGSMKLAEGQNEDAAKAELMAQASALILLSYNTIKTALEEQ